MTVQLGWKITWKHYFRDINHNDIHVTHLTRYDVSSIYFAVQWWNSSSNCFILLYIEFVLIRHSYIVNFLFGFVCIFLLCCINWMQISAINSNISNCKRKCNFVYYENIASTNFNNSTVYESVTKVLKSFIFNNEFW